MDEHYEMVEITWVDSWGVNPSWEDKEEAIAHDNCHVHTIGFLINKDPNSVRVAMSFDQTTGMICGLMVIPRKCIIQMTNVYGEEINPSVNV